MTACASSIAEHNDNVLKTIQHHLDNRDGRRFEGISPCQMAYA